MYLISSTSPQLLSASAGCRSDDDLNLGIDLSSIPFELDIATTFEFDNQLIDVNQLEASLINCDAFESAQDRRADQEQPHTDFLDMLDFEILNSEILQSLPIMNGIFVYLILILKFYYLTSYKILIFFKLTFKVNNLKHLTRMCYRMQAS